MRSSFIFKNRGFNNKAKSQHLGKYLGKCQVKEAVLFIPLYKMSKVLIPSCMKSFVNAPYAKKNVNLQACIIYSYFGESRPRFQCFYLSKNYSAGRK